MHSVRFDCGLPLVDGMSVYPGGNYSDVTDSESDTGASAPRGHGDHGRRKQPRRAQFRDVRARHAAWANAGCVIYYYDAKWDTNLTFVTHLMSAWGTEPIGAVMMVVTSTLPLWAASDIVVWM